MKNLRATLASVAAMALTASLATAAVAQDEPESVGVFSIEEMTWLLTSQVVDGEMTPVPEGVVVSLYMEGGEAYGVGGCNNYRTSYVLDGFDLTFGPVAANMMACQGPGGDVERAYLANLGNVAAYQSGGIQMALLDADGEFLLEFDLAPLGSVVGDWVATSINNGTGGVVSSAGLTEQVKATFTQHGQLNGNDGCNQYGTTYEVDNISISIAPEIASTRAACPTDELTEQSQQYFAALAAATNWDQHPTGTLELRDDDGALQVSFAPAGQ